MDQAPEPSTFHTQCTHCGFAYAVAPEQAAAMAGRQFACTNCGQPFTLSPSGAAFAQPTVSYASGADVKSNPLAIASLICGCLLCVPFLPGIASIITGAIGMRKTKDPAVTGKGLAIAGLVLGILNVLLWGAYFGFILAIMVPSMGMARGAANRVKCASNLRQIGQAIMLYGNENGGAYPDTFEQLILTQDVTADVFVCPESNDTKATGVDTQAIAKDMATGGHVSYVYLGKGFTEKTVTPQTVIAYESLANHGGTGMNVLMGDSSVNFVAAAQAATLMKQLQAGQNPPKTLVPPTATSAPAEVEQ
jgi:hypothetical protein